MKQLLFIGFCIVFLLTIAGCKEDDTELENNFSLNFGAKANSQTFHNGTIYTTTGTPNWRYKFAELGYYVDNIKVQKEDGTTVLLQDVAFIDFDAPTSFVEKLPIGNYKAIIFGLGLDPAHNATDPATQASGPLSTEYSSYFWSWTSLHIFGKLEGYFETTANSNNFNEGFVYHIGFDELYRTITLEKNFTVTNDAMKEIDVTLNLDKVFNGVTSLNLPTENNTQSFDNMPLAQKVLTNIQNAFE